MSSCMSRSPRHEHMVLIRIEIGRMLTIRYLNQIFTLYLLLSVEL